SLLVIAGVWLTLSASQGALLALTASSLLSISLACLALHIALLVVSWYASQLCALPRAKRLAVLFTASQKTMPIAVSVIISINSQLGVAVVTCIVFHLLQMVFDSLLASRINARWQQQNPRPLAPWSAQ
uniref:bile acid:sodium symporter n=1 Tax=Agarivorans sp. TaxID=1872412 RepID=UPI003D08CE10